MSANGESLPQGTNEVADVKGKGKGVEQPEVHMEDEEDDEETGEDEDEEVREHWNQHVVVTTDKPLDSNPNLKKVTQLPSRSAIALHSGRFGALPISPDPSSTCVNYRIKITH